MNPAHRLQEKPLKRTLNWLLFAKEEKNSLINKNPV